MAAEVRFEKVAITGGSGRLGQHVTARLEGVCDRLVVDLAGCGNSSAGSVIW